MKIPENKYLGNLCKRFHNWEGTGKSIRMKSNRHCVECEREFKIKYEKTEKRINYLAMRKIYAKDRIREIEKKCKLKHRDKYNEQSNLYHKKHRKENTERVKLRYHNDANYRVNAVISSRIRDTIKGGNGKHWEEYVGYSKKELMQHLEKQFLPGMSWDNYGLHGWHIDHIIPRSAFNFTSPEHIDFKRCWALSNLRPLWAKDNLLKRDKLLESFQPSLAL